MVVTDVRALFLRAEDVQQMQLIWRVEMHVEMVQDERQTLGQCPFTNVWMIGVASRVDASLGAALPDAGKKCRIAGVQRKVVAAAEAPDRDHLIRFVLRFGPNTTAAIPGHLHADEFRKPAHRGVAAFVHRAADAPDVEMIVREIGFLRHHPFAREF